MNEYDLFDAMGGIDDDLLLRSESRPVRKIPIRRTLIAAAAVMLLAVTAIATPAVREFISAKGSELVSGDIYITLEKLGLVDFYVPPSYEVALEVPNTPDVPEYIQDFRIPTYFEENGWIMDHVEISSATEPDCMSALFFAPDDPVPQVYFQQHVFYASDDPEVLQFSFSQNGMEDGELTEESITVGDYEATVYNGNTIIWTDGQYTYELILYYGADADEIEEAVLSMESADLWNGEYTLLEDTVFEGPKTPIETFYSLGKVPEGFALSNRTWNVNMAGETYTLDFWHHISLDQCVIFSEENYGPCFTIEDELFHLALDQREFTAEDYLIDGVQVTLIREEGAPPQLMWYRDHYCFSLSFSYDPGLTDEELLDYYRSVQPMPDYAENLTD